MGGPIEKSFEEIAKEGEQLPVPAENKVPVSAIIGAVIAIAGPDAFAQAISSAEKKEEVPNG
jgi:hypothetical protein